jgi:hypothetical protein
VQGILYALKWLPTEDSILKHAGVFNVLQKSKFSFNSVFQLVDRFNPYLNFSTNEMNMLGTEFLLYQSLQNRRSLPKVEQRLLLELVQLMETSCLFIA